MSLILDGTNGLSDIDGTAATPAIRGTDTNTGIFFPAVDTIAFSDGGVESMRVDSSGRVLIGSTSNPFNSLLYVTGTPTSNQPIISAYSQGGANVSGIGLYNDAASVGIWSQSGALTFRTNGSLGSGSETMRIDSGGNLLFNSGYGSVATAYGCRAWVNFNGSGTVAIRASGNVSSITDNNVGDYTINFTTAMPDANYTPVGMGAKNNNELIAISQPFGATPPTTSAVRVQSVFVNGSPTDATGIYVAIIR